MTNRILARLGRVFIVSLVWLAVVFSAHAQQTPTSTPPATMEATPPASPVVVATPAVVATPDRAAGFGRFGVIESFEDPAAATRLGATWTRARFHWAEMQPDGPRQWQPPLDDEALAVELDAGREVVGLLIGIPEWARDRQGLPRGLALPVGDPGNTWAVFVGRVVEAYAGSIDRWIIWNEPDIDDPDAPGHTWDGDVAEFAQLQRVAYSAAKAANPNAVIHLGAFTYFWDPGYFDRLLESLAADPQAAANDHYFDVATAHLYFQPNAVYNVLYAFRQVMDDHGLDKPIWLVETNAPPMNDPYWEVPNWTLAVTLNEQAAFIPQALAAALSAGAERVAVYKLKDTEGDRAANPEPFGLLRWDDSRRPAFDTYRVAIRLLDGVTAAERERWDAVGQVRLAQAEQTTTVLFARLPESQTVRVPATAATAQWIDMWGQKEEIIAARGYFTVELPGALCLQTIADYCMIGGTTYYLIQSNERGPAAEQAATRAAVATRAAASTLTVTATARPMTTPRATPAAPTPAATTTPTRRSPTPPITPGATDTATTAPSTATDAATATRVPATVTPPARPTAMETRATPEPIAPNTPAEGRGPAGYSGLLVIGLGLLLGLGLAGWRWTGRRRQ